MEVQEIRKLKNPLILFRNTISRSRENPGDLENRHEYFMYFMYAGQRKKDHTEIKRWEYFLI
jgi:hypothetical protein